MQPLDNDMDDLFREAAENYPLRVSGADWDKVAGALSAQSNQQPLSAKGGGKKYFWLLLLLAAPLVCNIYHPFSGSNDAASSAAIITEQSKNQIPEDDNAGTNKIAGSATGIATSVSAPVTVPSDNYDASTFSSDLSAYVHKSNTDQKAQTAVQVTSPDAEQDAVAEEKIISAPETATDKPEPEEKKQEVKVPGNVADDKKKDSAATGSLLKKEKQSKKNEKKLYINLLAGPDASRVKGRAEERLGGSAGLTLGFNINKHFAIEAGALYSVKHYSTEYTYFDNSKTQWPANRIIKVVDGTCKMIEIPVSVRYNFAVTTQSKFFASAGLSSYLMKKEDYDYTFTLATSTAQNEVYKTYKKSGNNLFSVLQLSAGWQRNIGRFGAVRVQPYYNVPLNGVGIGKLPLSGAGVLAGISIPIK